MTDQTPSTEDVRRIVGYAVRTAAAHGVAQGKHDEDRGSSIGALIDQAVNEIAARDREVAAKALYDARDDWRKGGWAGTPHHHDRGRDRIAAAQYAGNWLNDRADRIRPGHD